MYIHYIATYMCVYIITDDTIKITSCIIEVSMKSSKNQVKQIFVKLVSMNY